MVIIIPDYKWNTSDKVKLHLLAIPTDKSIRSIRSLSNDHVDLLKHMQAKITEISQSLYGVKSSELKMYFHYSPSTYHLHIHVATTKNSDINSSVEYSHELSRVIFNLQNMSDYYKHPMLKRS